MPTSSLEDAEAWYRSNVNARVKAVKEPAKAAEAKQPAPPPADDPIETGLLPDYREARARREAAEADIAEHKAAELRGALIRRDVVLHAEEKKAAAVKESLLQWPAQLAPVVAAETDMGRCYDILMDAVMGILAKISTRSA